MTKQAPPARRLTRAVGFAGLVAAATAVALAAAHAQPLTEQQLIEALRDRSGTRSFVSKPRAGAPASTATAAPVTAANDVARQKELDAMLLLLSRQGTRAFTSKRQRDRVADVTAGRPTHDMEIYFGFNSADITPRAMTSLAVLGRAMRSPDLSSRAFVIAGHTDAKGTDQYNLELSRRRAASVRNYLAKEFGIDAGRLLSVGYGEERLKQPTQPYADVNRRVQITNVGTSKMVSPAGTVATSRR